MPKLSFLILFAPLMLQSDCNGSMTVEEMILYLVEDKSGVRVQIESLTDTLSKAEFSDFKFESKAGEILLEHGFRLRDSTSTSTPYIPKELKTQYSRSDCDCLITQYYSIIPNTTDIRKTMMISCK